MQLNHAKNAADFKAAHHDHIGRTERVGFFKALVGIATGRSRKVLDIQDRSAGRSQTVALEIDHKRFMLTIARSFVLLTLQEGSSRFPIIHKNWKCIERNRGEGLAAEFGTIEVYFDSDRLRWEHRFGRAQEHDELCAFDSHGKESLTLTMET